MASVRPPAVAGTFYPEDPRELRAVLTEFLRGAATAGPVPKAIIVPHAGYPFSGPVAASAYALWGPARGTITRVVLLGPTHFVPFAGLALPSATRFATPLGDVAIDRGAVASIVDLPQVRIFDRAHAEEHSLEVHLPFLQVVLGEFQLVPLVVGDVGAEEVAAVLDRLWGGAETRIVVSSDLSHYHDPATARRMDHATSRAIEALRCAEVGPQGACGWIPVSGLLCAARGHGLRGRTVDLRNSGDTAGSTARVVGYGAFAFDCG